MPNRIEAERLLFRLHALTPAYQRRVERLRAALARVDAERAYVSFSAGKDSAVLAHAAHAALPGIPIVMADAGVPTQWTADDRARWIEYAARSGWRLLLMPREKWSVEVTSAASEAAHRKSVHAGQFAAIEAWAAAEGRTQKLIGLRAEEAPGRRATLGAHGEHYRAADGSERVCPLGLWSVRDIWAYIIQHELPWLSLYDHLGAAARSGIIGRNATRYGRQVWLRKHYPEAYRYARDVLGLDYVRENA